MAYELVELEIVEEISYQTVGMILKKLAQAAPEEAVVDPAAIQRRVRLADGGCARCLHPPL